MSSKKKKKKKWTIDETHKLMCFINSGRHDRHGGTTSIFPTATTLCTVHTIQRQ